MLTGHTYLQLTVACIIGVLGSARATRLLVADGFPPIVSLRIWYADHVPQEWGKLASCPWCMAPYVVAGDMAWALAGNLDIIWYVVNGWAAASYAAAYIVLKDED